MKLEIVKRNVQREYERWREEGNERNKGGREEGRERERKLGSHGQRKEKKRQEDVVKGKVMGVMEMLEIQEEEMRERRWTREIRTTEERMNGKE